MTAVEKVVLQILVMEDHENVCAKCCKTIQVIDRMMEAIPEFNKNVNILYIDINDEEVVKKYGDLNSPVVLINDSIFSEGHVPIIKKLSRELLNQLK